MSEQLGDMGGEHPDLESAVGAMHIAAELMQQLTTAADVTAAFGDPQTVGDRTIITAAEVLCGFGFGMGSGDKPAGPEGVRRRSGTGIGGGGATRARPVAAIVVEPEGVSVRPIVDVTQLGLAALSTGVFGILWVGRLMRR